LQVGGNVRRVAEQLVEIVPRSVVEGETRRFAQLGVEVMQPLAAELSLALQHLPFGRGKDAVEAAQHGERQDHILVLAALERIADQVRDAPDEADNLAVIH
jgi:hypothetical protein